MKTLKTLLIAVALVSALAAIGKTEDKPTPNDFLVIPGVRAGPISADSREAYLRKVLGNDNVRPANIDDGEGGIRSGTVIFPNDPSRRAEIFWIDSASHRRPAEVIISSPATVWHTAENISIGSTLDQIERVNGKPFHMSGFNFDDAGTIIDGNGGKLSYLGVDKGEEGIQGRLLLVRLDKAEAAWDGLGAKAQQALTGDVSLLSSLPAVRKLSPVVYQLIVKFPER